MIQLEDGKRVYFAGDTCVFGDMQLIARLYEPDVAVLPIGDHFTMGPREAALALELLGNPRCVPVPLGTFPLLTGTPDAARRADSAPGRADRARGDGRAVSDARERWFGATGRRVPEIALEGELDLDGALVLDSVDDVDGAARGARRPDGPSSSVPDGRRGQARARAARGRVRPRHRPARCSSST